VFVAGIYVSTTLKALDGFAKRTLGYLGKKKMGGVTGRRHGNEPVRKLPKLTVTRCKMQRIDSEDGIFI